MNILYIAQSCDPTSGSEDKIGWSIPWTNAISNNVFVITRTEKREVIDSFLSNNEKRNIKFYYVDISPLYKKAFRGFLYSARLNRWNKKALPIASKICKEERIDIVHQITPIEFRSIGEYYKIPSVKFVCGPLGGAEYTPKGLKYYYKKHSGVEMFRSCINSWYKFKFSLTKKLNKCDCVLYANEETYYFLNRE